MSENVHTSSASVGVTTSAPLPAATYYATLPPNTPGTPSSPVANNSTYEVIPHRIFVGGFAAGTTEQELRSFFESFGSVREVKVIRNPEGSSKGYGFVTFENETEAQNVRGMDADKLEFKGRRLNLGPAMRRINYGNRFSDFAISSPSTPFYQPAAYQYAIPQYLMDPAATAYAVAAPNTTYPPSPTYLVVPQAQYIHPYSGYATPATPNQQQQLTSLAQLSASNMQPQRLVNTMAHGQARSLSPGKTTQMAQYAQQLSPQVANVNQQHQARGMLGNTAITRTPTRAAAGATVAHVGGRPNTKQNTVDPMTMLAVPTSQAIYQTQPQQTTYLNLTNDTSPQPSAVQQNLYRWQQQTQQYPVGATPAGATSLPQQMQTFYPTPNTPSQQQQQYTAVSGSGGTTYVGGNMMGMTTGAYPGGTDVGSLMAARSYAPSYNDYYTNEQAGVIHHHGVSLDHEQSIASLGNGMESMKM